MKKRIKKFIKSIWGVKLLLEFKRNNLTSIKNADLVFFFPYYHLGGAEQVHLDIARALSNRNIVIIFTHLSAKGHFKAEFSKYATLVELNSIINKKNNWITQQLFKSIVKTINKSKSVQKVFGCNTNYYYDILPQISKIKIDLIHSFAPSDHRREMLVKAAKFLDYRVVINQKALDTMYQYYDDLEVPKILKTNLLIIGNAVPFETFNLNKKNINNEVRIGYVGRWSEEKRPELFLQIANQFHNFHNNYHFLMAGSGMSQHKKKIETSGITYLGSIDNKTEMNELYASLDYIVITSLYEGFPMVIMESMPYGVIPICTNVGGIREHISHKENGILIDSIDEQLIVNLMVEHIKYLENNQDQKNRISLKTQKYAFSNFNLQVFNNKYQKLLS